MLARRAGARSAGPAAAGRVAVFVEGGDVSQASPSQWAVQELQRALTVRGVETRVVRQRSEAGSSGLLIVVAGRDSSLSHDLAPLAGPQSFAIVPLPRDGGQAVLVKGHDPLGLVYALTELADVAAMADDAVSGIAGYHATGRPANAVRGCMRMFCSDIEDKAWFLDREFWTRYLTMLVSQRFNRFNLSLGLGYDFTREVRDAYLHFAYPFLLKVPGYPVRATHLTDAERDRNLELLRFIGDEAALRGLSFQLGLWTHAYEWTDSPDANHTIEGLTRETHGPYCRAALEILLKECPSISGVTLRTHGESGVSEDSYEFWRMLFEGVARSGRSVEIDLHAKGLDRRTIEAALATGQPVTVSPKFWAEHMGLPYHQAWIRTTELPHRERGEGLFSRSSGSRSFLRYGYGDLLAEDRRYAVLHRIWPGTQRLLLWGDPLFASAYGRQGSFCGSQGIEIMEPLSFKGRKGSGRKGARTGYLDGGLVTRHDFEKYLYGYRLWGRLLYDPESSPETWRRLLTKEYGRAAPAVETALGASSRILPLLTTAHAPSAANNHWWPEMPVNMSIVDPSHPEPFTDTPSPKRFGTVSPLDPQLFSGVDQFADELAKHEPSGRYNPADVAALLDELAATSARSLAEARSLCSQAGDPRFRRFAVDTGITIELGRFFADKLRAALLYALFERTSDRRLLRQAVDYYRSARAAWMRVIDLTTGVYVEDVSYGIAWYQRGHWADRLAAIDRDVAALERRLGMSPSAAAPGDDTHSSPFEAAIQPRARPVPSVRHVPPSSFEPGRPLALTIASTDRLASARLWYRHTNQAEPWQRLDLEPAGEAYGKAIPKEYADSVFPLQYYFECVSGERAWLHPGFDRTLSNLPYFVVRPVGNPRAQPLDPSHADDASR